MVPAHAHAVLGGCASDIGCQRSLVGIVYTGEATQIARTRSFVQSLRIAFFADMQGSINVNFKEAPYSVANLVAGSPVGRNGSCKSDDSIASQ